MPTGSVAACPSLSTRPGMAPSAHGSLSHHDLICHTEHHSTNGYTQASSAEHSLNAYRIATVIVVFRYVKLSSAISGNHCRSDPVQVQSTRFGVPNAIYKCFKCKISARCFFCLRASEAEPTCMRMPVHVHTHMNQRTCASKHKQDHVPMTTHVDEHTRTHFHARAHGSSRQAIVCDKGLGAQLMWHMQCQR